MNKDTSYEILSANLTSAFYYTIYEKSIENNIFNENKYKDYLHNYLKDLKDNDQYIADIMTCFYNNYKKYIPQHSKWTYSKFLSAFFKTFIPENYLIKLNTDQLRNLLKTLIFNTNREFHDFILQNDQLNRLIINKKNSNINNNYCNELIIKMKTLLLLESQNIETRIRSPSKIINDTLNYVPINSFNLILNENKQLKEELKSYKNRMKNADLISIEKLKRDNEELEALVTELKDKLNILSKTKYNSRNFNTSVANTDSIINDNISIISKNTKISNNDDKNSKISSIFESTKNKSILKEKNSIISDDNKSKTSSVIDEINTLFDDDN